LAKEYGIKIGAIKNNMRTQSFWIRKQSICRLEEYHYGCVKAPYFIKQLNHMDSEWLD